MISIASPIIGPEEIEAVNKVLKSNILAQGPVVHRLEENFAEFCGTKYACALSSGTAAIHASLYAAGIKPGDEVITTPFSFIATVNPIIFLGAKPVFVDIDPNTFNINAADIKKKITNKTKAIIPVHLYGQLVDTKKILDIAKKHNLIVIEDACQAIGASINGVKAGDFGDLGCFSLYATKNIMCGEGGMITSNNPTFIEKIKQFRQHGMSAQYEYVDVGYNYRMTDFQAAIAVEQLKKADAFNEARRKNAKRLYQGLKNTNNFILPNNIGSDSHVFHQFTIRLTQEFPIKREKLIESLKERGIIAGVYYHKPLHYYKHIAKYGYKVGDFKYAEEAAAQVVSLPVHPNLTSGDVDKIITSINELARVK